MSTKSKGSEWKKWDLHIHTPESLLNPQFEGASNEEQWKNYFSSLEELEDISVIGVTDYYCIEGYKKVKKKKDDGGLQNIDFILPNVELRLTTNTSDKNPLNIHVLFNPDFEDKIETNFFQKLTFKYDDTQYGCTITGLKALGKAFKSDISEDRALLREGMNQFKVCPEGLENLFDKDKNLRENSFIVLPNDSRSGASGFQENSQTAFRETLYKFTDAIFSGSSSDRDYFLGKKADAVETIRKKYGKLKPCIHGSDAHTNAKIGKPDRDKFTWVKAETSFNGLKQILIEPELRVFIGKEPEQIQTTKNNATKIISQIKITKVVDSELSEDWFDNTVFFNPELTSVIGNKGSGKSALADILGLLGSSKQEKHFSFLNEKKFKAKKINKAKNFLATLEWESGDAISKNLNDEIEENLLEKIKYIPQNYLEEICNEIDSGKSFFYKELKKVVFSHTNKNDQLEKNSLDDLIQIKSGKFNDSTETYREDIKKINTDICDYRQKLTKAYKEGLTEKLNEKKQELESHSKNKPQEIPKPKATNEDAVADSHYLTKKKEELDNLNTVSFKYNKELREKAAELSALENLDHKLKQLSAGFNAKISELEEEYKFLSLPISSLIGVNYSPEKIILKISVLKKEVSKLKNATEGEGSIQLKIGKAKKSIEDLIAKMEGPVKKYQEYLGSLAKWQEEGKKIKGDSLKDFGSMLHIESQLREILNIPQEVSALVEKRSQITKQIYLNIQKTKEVYEELYKPIQDFVKKTKFNIDNFTISFKTSIVPKNSLPTDFLNFIDQTVRGTFKGGANEGRKKLAGFIRDCDFTKVEEVMKFTEELDSSLHSDSKEPAGKGSDEFDPQKQLKGSSFKEVYDYIFKLEYLEPKYSLELNEKNIQQLSPGERGVLLLVFYLMIDKDDRPLVIDQPEENLDNQTIYKVLVPCIKEAKKRRQIIMITHNPNLAIVCDSEQIIHAKIEKNNNNTVSYQSGGIESPTINKAILDILEGTRPAFENRGNKYFSES